MEAHRPNNRNELYLYLRQVHIESLGRINAKRRILFVQDKKNVHSDMLEIMDASDL